MQTSMQTPVQTSVLPAAGNLLAFEIAAGDEAELQAFFEASPAYFQAIHGQPAVPGEAREEIHGNYPAGWHLTKVWLIGYRDQNNKLVAFVNMASDLLAPGVWHIGTFLVATSLHGSGVAQTIHGGLEAWAKSNGAQWIRLGAVVGNHRAERFWLRQGYVPVREREGVAMGKLVNTLRVMVKGLVDRPMVEYLTLVARDRPEGWVAT